jgi:hypothetical protein
MPRLPPCRDECLINETSAHNVICFVRVRAAVPRVPCCSCMTSLFPARCNAKHILNDFENFCVEQASPIGEHHPNGNAVVAKGHAVTFWADRTGVNFLMKLWSEEDRHRLYFGACW